jgi:hypothetical protein
MKATATVTSGEEFKLIPATEARLKLADGLLTSEEVGATKT